jgi:uncharacterized phiE125 gp8 family phage protein
MLLPMTWRRLGAAPSPILTLAEAKRQVNAVDFSDDDDLLTAIVAAVSEFLELQSGILGRPLITQSWQVTAPNPLTANLSVDPRMRGFAPATGFILDRAPLQSVTAVEYLSSGAYATLDASLWTTRTLSQELTLVRLVTGSAWPKVDDDEAAWRISVTLGYGDAVANVPGPIRHAAKMLVGHFYQNREAVTGFGAALQETPIGVAALLGPFRAPNF